MIRINLIRTTAPKRKTASFSMATLVKPLVTIAVVALVGLSVTFGVRWFKNRPVHEPVMAVKEEKNAAVKSPEQAVPDEAPVATGFEPSTHLAQKMVEDVVSDVETVHQKGEQSALARLSYSEMSRAEQINYEFSFAKNVLQILTRAVPEGIGFSTLSIDSFQKVSAHGIAQGRGQVTSLFTNLRREKFEISTPPRSTIRPGGGKGFRFSFSCEVPLGTNPAESWLLTDHLESRHQLGTYIKTFSRLASRNGVVLSHGLTHIKSYKTGPWRRSVYHLSGKGSYRNFVKFVLAGQQTRLPCAFSMIMLRARTGGSVDISADVVFTTRY